MAIQEIIKKLPIELDGAVEHLQSKGVFTKNYLIYRKGFYYEALTGLKRNCVDVYCTHCKSSFKMSKTLDNKGKMTFFNDLTNKAVQPHQETECPECKHYVTPIPLSDFKRYSIHIGTIFVTSVHNIDGALCLLSWSVEERLSRTGELKFFTHALDGNIFGKEGCFSVTACRPYMGGVCYYGTWSVNKKFTDMVGCLNNYYVYPYKKSIVENSDFPNCKLNEYIFNQERAHPALYMYLYCKHPNVENLIVDIGPEFIQNAIEKAIKYELRHYITPKRTLSISKLDLLLDKVKPNEILGLTKEEYKYLKSRKESLFMMRAFAHNKKSFTLNQYDELVKILSDGSIDKNTLEELYPFIERSPGFTLRKAIKYITEQRTRQKKVRIDWDYYIDYLTMRKRLKSKSEIFPRDLVVAHDYILAKYNEKLSKDREKKASKEAEKTAAIFTKRYEQLEKFIFSQGKYTIVPCKSETELFDEGDKLHHCVYSNYKTSYMSGRTAIFFIRNKEKPTVPLYTVEFDENNIQIRQNRGLRNCDPPADAL